MTPGALRTGKGTFYTVFTPFKKAWLARLTDAGVPRRRPRPRAQPSLDPSPTTCRSASKGFRRPDDALVDHWPAGEAAAQRRLARFVKDGASRTTTSGEIYPAVDGTSSLSPYLAVGAISVGDCLAAAADANRGRLSDGDEGRGHVDQRAGLARVLPARAGRLPARQHAPPVQARDRADRVAR